jgi:hypothetical protein
MNKLGETRFPVTLFSEYNYELKFDRGSWLQIFGNLVGAEGGK